MGPVPSSGETSPIGSVIAAKYRIEAALGQGSRGTVYRALQIDLERDVALKLVSGVDEDGRARFLREARLAADVRHPCVAEVFDAGVTEDGTPYCAMELLQGETLAARIARKGPIGAREAVGILAGICSAVAAVHGKGLVHRDIKPGNIFLAQRQDGGVDPKLIDFGIAKRIDLGAEVVRRVHTARGLGGPRAPAPTAPGVVLGTPLYLSPEQIMGEKLDGRSDVHALGATLYEALSGGPPFPGEDAQSILGRILSEAPEPLGQRAPEAGIPEALDREVLRALAKDPAERHASAADFANALWTALAVTRRDSPPAPAPVPMPLPVRSVGRPVMAVVLIVMAALLVLAWRRRAPTPALPSQTSTTSQTVPTASPSASAPPEIAVSPPPTSEAVNQLAPKTKRPQGPPSHPSTAPTATAATSANPFRIDDLKIPY